MRAKPVDIAVVAQPPLQPAAAVAAGRTAQPARPPARMVVEPVEHPSALSAHLAAWEDLAASAAEPNVFYEPWMLRPAVDTLGAGRDLLFVLVYEDGPQGENGRRLCGFFPLERRRSYKRLPFGTLALWQHMHCYDCTPLLRAGAVRPALAALLDWAGRDPRGASLVEFGCTRGDGAFRQALIDCLNERQAAHAVSEIYNRPLLRRHESAERFLQASLSPGFRKEARRLRKRLAEKGRLELRVLRTEREFGAWFTQFLELEASGWKGLRGSGTAIALSSDESGFLARAWQEGMRRGRLQLIGLFLDDRPVALSADLLAADGGYHFKIAYDEAEAHYSPGVQLELELIGLVHERPGLQWLDSCATPDHFMMRRLWHDQRTMQSLVVSTGRASADLAVALLPALRCLKRLGLRALHRQPPAT